MEGRASSFVALLLLLCTFCSCCEAAYDDSFLSGFKGPFPTLGGFAGTEISSTVSLLYQSDWDVDFIGQSAEDWSSKCIDMLYRANQYNAKVVNFMITHYWVDNNYDGKVSSQAAPPAALCQHASVRSCQHKHTRSGLWPMRFSHELCIMAPALRYRWTTTATKSAMDKVSTQLLLRLSRACTTPPAQACMRPWNSPVCLQDARADMLKAVSGLQGLDATCCAVLCYVLQDAPG